MFQFRRNAGFLEKMGRMKEGMNTALKEAGIRKEVAFIVFSLSVVPFFLVPLWAKVALIMSSFFPLFAELVNTAIEKAVDTATRNFSITAKKSKNIASVFVYGVIAWTLALWIIILFFTWNMQ